MNSVNQIDIKHIEEQGFSPVVVATFGETIGAALILRRVIAEREIALMARRAAKIEALKEAA